MRGLSIVLAAALIASPAFAQPPAAPDQGGAEADTGPVFDLPAEINLTNASKVRPDRPAKPRPDRTKDGKIVGKAAQTIDEMRAKAEAEGQPVEAVFMGDLIQGLANLSSGVPTNRIPAGQIVEVTGEIWLADGGYSPRVTSIATNGGFNNAIDLNPGGPGIYGSATSYSVNGDNITITKAMVIGNQSVAIPAMTVRSGQTATLQLPDGSVFRVTPVIKPGP